MTKLLGYTVSKKVQYEKYLQEGEKNMEAIA
jgi:hypothetical protein